MRNKIILAMLAITFTISAANIIQSYIPEYYELYLVDFPKYEYIKVPVSNVDKMTSIVQEELRDDIHPVVTFKKPSITQITYTTITPGQPHVEVYKPQTSGHLTKSSGVFYGPSGKETYYNLDMSGVINIMRNAGYSEAEYPYWVRDDGCKMLGQYIMLGGDIINTRNRGDIVETSLGTGMLCDHCVNAQMNDPTLIDIAVTW